MYVIMYAITANRISNASTVLSRVRTWKVKLRNLVVAESVQ